MGKLLGAFFYVPKHVKVCEKTMIQRAVTTVSVVILCLMAMGLTAYAYFSHSIVSATHTIQAASFEADVSVTVTDGDSQPVDVVKINSKTHKAALQPGACYTVSLTRKGTAATGFCILSAPGSKAVYHTRQLGEDIHAKTAASDTLTFYLKVTKETEVTFYAHWGTSSHYPDYVDKGTDGAWYIVDEETVTLQMDGSTPPSSGESETTTTTTTTVTPSTQSSETLYRIQPGDTLWDIARAYGLSVTELKAHNGLTSNTIRPGEDLKIPLSESAPATTVTTGASETTQTTTATTQNEPAASTTVTTAEGGTP